MAEVNLIKMSDGSLRPADQSDADILSKVKSGSFLAAEFKQPRNAKFHRRYFAMLNFCFEFFEPVIPITKRGIVPQKNFDKFPEDVTILAGYYDVVVNIKGEARYQAKSISFASMDDTEFEKLYKSVFSVCWQQVLQYVQGMTPEIADNTILQLLSFD